MFGGNFFGGRYFGRVYWGQQAATNISVHFGGIWRSCKVYVNTLGTWQQPTSSGKYGGSWRGS